jgi:hypothetical protein
MMMVVEEVGNSVTLPGANCWLTNLSVMAPLLPAPNSQERSRKNHAQCLQFGSFHFILSNKSSDYISTSGSNISYVE